MFYIMTQCWKLTSLGNYPNSIHILEYPHHKFQTSENVNVERRPKPIDSQQRMSLCSPNQNNHSEIDSDTDIQLMLDKQTGIMH